MKKKLPDIPQADIDPETGVDSKGSETVSLTEAKIREIIQEEISKITLEPKVEEPNEEESDAEPEESDEDGEDSKHNTNRISARGRFKDDTVDSVRYITDPIRFKNRTRLAWTSVFAMIGLAGFLFIKVPPENIDEYSTIIGWCMSTFAAVILAYMGATSWTQTVFAKVLEPKLTKKKK